MSQDKDAMTGYERMKKHREQDLEHSTRELERLADAHKGSSHYLSQEAYKLGLKYAIRQIEGTEMLLMKALKEIPYANPKEAERENQNQMNILGNLKACLIRRYEGKP